MNPYRSDNTDMEPLRNMPPAIWPVFPALTAGSVAVWMFVKIVIRLSEFGPHFRDFSEMFAVVFFLTAMPLMAIVFFCFSIARIHERLTFISRVR